MCACYVLWELLVFDMCATNQKAKHAKNKLQKLALTGSEFYPLLFAE